MPLRHIGLVKERGGHVVNQPQSLLNAYQFSEFI